MRILQVISKNDRYGAQRIFLDQVAALRDLGNEVHVAVRGERGFVTDSVQALGIPCYGIAMRGLQDVLSLRRLVRRKAIDVIHTTLDRADYFGIAVGKLTGRPVVSTVMVPRCHPGLRFMDRLVALSRHQRAQLELQGVRSGKLLVIRPGIDVARFGAPDAAARERWRGRLRTDAFSIILCHISSMQARKAHGVSLELVAECRRRGERPLLIIIADPLQGAYYDSLIGRIAHEGLTENVAFTGWTADVPELLSLSHFSVLPSEKEALGVVLMEGMAAGTPIIAREGEGGAELIEDYGAGFIYRPEAGTGVLAAEILATVRDPARYRALSDHCRTTARERFSRLLFGQRLLDLYREVL